MKSTPLTIKSSLQKLWTNSDDFYLEATAMHAVITANQHLALSAKRTET